MSHQSITELDILSEVIAPKRATLEPAVAHSILQWKFPVKSVARMNRLAMRNSTGKITADEREELERFLRVGSLIDLVQAKARVSLQLANAS